MIKIRHILIWAVYFLLLSFVSPSAALGQSDSLDYNNIKNKLDYERSKTVWIPKAFKSLQQQKPRQKTSFEGLDNIMQIIGYILIGLLLIILVVYALKWNKNNKKTIQSIDLENIENIEGVDLESLLDTALNNKDYRLAFRIKYLSLLQSLNITKAIKWKPYKTNRNYVIECSDQSYSEEFKKISQIFDYTWYGQSAISKIDYEANSKEIDSLNKIISNGE